MGRRVRNMCTYHTVPRSLTQEEDRLSDCEIVIYLWLCEMEQQFTKDYITYPNEKDWFYCTDAQLSKASGKNIKTVQKAKALLKEKGYIETWLDKETGNPDGKSSTRQPTHYRILK